MLIINFKESTQVRAKTNKLECDIAGREQKIWAKKSEETGQIKNEAEKDVNIWKQNTEKAYRKTRYSKLDP